MARTRKFTADLTIDGHGFYTIRSLTQRGADWLREHVMGAFWINDDTYANCDDSRMTDDIAQAAFDDSLTIAVNGFKYIGNGKGDKRYRLA